MSGMHLFAYSLWLTGLALLLATLSFTHWQTLNQNRSFRRFLGEPATRSIIIAGLLLVSLGLTVVAPVWWQKVIWASLLLWSLWQGWLLWESQSADMK